MQARVLEALAFGPWPQTPPCRQTDTDYGHAVVPFAKGLFIAVTTEARHDPGSQFAAAGRRASSDACVIK